MPESKYYVLNGHTFGHINPLYPKIFGVLQGDIFKNGHDWKNGPVTIVPSDKLEPATLANFERFRVCPKGHIA